MTDELASESIIPFSEITNMTKFPQDNAVYEFAYSIFQEEFNQIRELSPTGHNFTLLFNTALNQAFDNNFLRKQEYVDQKNGSILSAAAAPMLNRNGWIHMVENRGSSNLNFYQLDIANFRQADLGGSADYLLNLIAGQFNRVMADFNHGKNSTEIGLVGRYGGDEFVLALPKSRSSEAEQLLRSIKLQIETVEGFYRKSDGQINQEKVQLKEERDKPAIKKFEVDDDPTHQQIFNTYLSRGVLLENDEVVKIVNQFTVGGVLNKEKLSQFLTQYRYDPNKLYDSDRPLSDEEKIKFLIAKNQDFKMAFGLTKALDDLSRERGEIQIESRLTRTQALIRFIEGAVFDRLLGDIFSSYGVIKDGLLANQYDNLFSVDIKLLKEVNSEHSYGDGDVMVHSVWKKISETLGDKREYFEIARRGGTYVLALKKNSVLTDTDLKSLRNLNEVEVTLLNGKVAKIPIGFSELKCTQAPAEESLQKPWLDEQFAVTNQAGEVWLANLLNWQAKPDDLPGEYLYRVLTEPDSNDWFAQLMIPYFSGARFWERIETIEQVIKSKDINHPNLINQLEKFREQKIVSSEVTLSTP